MSKLNLLANLAALYARNGSSEKALEVALTICFFKSSIPLKGSIISPVNTSFAIEFIVKSLLFKSSRIVIFFPVVISNSL